MSSFKGRPLALLRIATFHWQVILTLQPLHPCQGLCSLTHLGSARCVWWMAVVSVLRSLVSWTWVTLVMSPTEHGVGMLHNGFLFARWRHAGFWSGLFSVCCLKCTLCSWPVCLCVLIWQIRVKGLFSTVLVEPFFFLHVPWAVFVLLVLCGQALVLVFYSHVEELDTAGFIKLAFFLCGISTQ